MIVEILAVGPFMENTYVAGCEKTKECIIVDPGDEAERIYNVIERHGFTPKFIANTHAHIDHVGAVAEVKKHYGIDFLLHRAEKPVLDSVGIQGSMFGVGRIEIPEVERWLEEGDTISFGDISGKVIHTPGHTPGGICFHFGDVLFSGDTLFAGSIGRTDLPGGSYEQIMDSIKKKLVPLGDDVKVYSGHGPKTTIGQERKANPFITGKGGFFF